MIKKQRSSDQQIQSLVATTLLDTATNITGIVSDAPRVAYLSLWHSYELCVYGYSEPPVRWFRGAMPRHRTPRVGTVNGGNLARP